MLFVRQIYEMYFVDMFSYLQNSESCSTLGKLPYILGAKRLYSSSIF